MSAATAACSACISPGGGFSCAAAASLRIPTISLSGQDLVVVQREQERLADGEGGCSGNVVRRGHDRCLSLRARNRTLTIGARDMLR